MGTAQLIIGRRRDDVLEGAVRLQSQIILSQRKPDTWAICKGKFVAELTDPQRLVLQCYSPKTVDQPLPRRPLQPTVGERIGVSFRSGHSKCMFDATVESLQPDSTGDHLTIRWPEEIRRVQRRVFQRAEPPNGMIIAVRFWADSPSGYDHPPSPHIKNGQLVNISAGGMCVKVAHSDNLLTDRLYRCALTASPGSQVLLIEAVLRHLDQDEDGRIELGFQFIGLEISREGRKTLDRIVRLISQFHQPQRRQSHVPDSALS